MSVNEVIERFIAESSNDDVAEATAEVTAEALAEVAV